MFGTIVLIDDDNDIRDTVCELLKDDGFMVSCFGDVDRALAHLRSAEQPHLILLDLMMPDIDGWAFLNLQRQDPKLAGIPVVVTTAARAGHAVMDRLLPVPVIYKPFEYETLLTMVQKYLKTASV